MELFLTLKQPQKVRQRLIPVNKCQQEKKYRTWVMYTVCLSGKTNSVMKELHKALCIFLVCSFIWLSGASLEIFKSLIFPIDFNASMQMCKELCLTGSHGQTPIFIGVHFLLGSFSVLLHAYSFQPSLCKSPH